MGPMFRPRRPIARLAVGAAAGGAAYHVGRRRAEQDQYNEQAAEAYATSQAPPPPQYVAPPPTSTGGEIDELGRLVHMHDSGDLTDDEFAAAKARLLGI